MNNKDITKKIKENCISIYNKIYLLIYPQRDKNILMVAQKAGWDYLYTEEQMKHSKEYLGISFSDYKKYNFYQLSYKEQINEYYKILNKKDKNTVQQINRLERVVKGNRLTTLMEEKKWDYNQAADYLLENKEDAPLLKNAIEKVMRITNWNEEYTRKKILESRKSVGCTYKEYVLYRFYQLDIEEQKKFFLIKDSKILSNKYDTNKKFKKMLGDKELTNQYFEKYMKRSWCVNTKVSLEEFCEKFCNSKKIIYKPLHGNRGKGIEAYELTQDNLKTVYDVLKTYPEGVVEEYIVQHHELNALCGACVNTIRIVTISSNKQKVVEDKNIDIAYAALRFGGGESIVDNFHSGGMTAAIDLTNGRLITNAIDMEGNVFQKHPKTGVEIKGFQIPLFFDAVNLVMDAIKENSIEGYLGWDLAITEDGPVVVEINTKPGVVLLSTPYAAEGKGMKYVMEKYM